MKCITRYDMKFGDIIIPARTECTIINNKNYSPNCPGVFMDVIVNNWDIDKKEIENEFLIKEYNSSINKAKLTGIVLTTNTQSVFVDANNKYYYDYMLSEYQLEKIFSENNIPKEIKIYKNKYLKNGEAKLYDVIEYFEEKLHDWVCKNCEFQEVSQEQLDNGEINSDFDVGMKVLTDIGLEQFYNKSMEYKNKLEQATGLTYNFKGGLIWAD